MSNNGIVSKRSLFILLVIFQLGVLGFMIGKREHLLKTGTTVKLQCVPVDPRSLFSGDYVTLRYTITEFTHQEFKDLSGDEKIKKNDTVYVALSMDEDGVSRKALGITKKRGTLSSHRGPVIRGTVEEHYNRWKIVYGLESYFVPQNQGKEIEKHFKDVIAETAVSPMGEAALKKLFINGKEVSFY